MVTHKIKQSNTDPNTTVSELEFLTNRIKQTLNKQSLTTPQNDTLLLAIATLVIVFAVIGIIGFNEYKKMNLASAASGIYGQVISKSDVVGVPETPIADSLIFMMTREDFDVWYQNSNGIIDDSLQINPSTYVKTDTNGNYEILITENIYALCLLFPEGENTFKLADCVEIAVSSNSRQQVNISRQFDTEFSCINENTCTPIDLSRLNN